MSVTSNYCCNEVLAIACNDVVDKTASDNNDELQMHSPHVVSKGIRCLPFDFMQQKPATGPRSFHVEKERMSEANQLQHLDVRWTQVGSYIHCVYS